MATIDNGGFLNCAGTTTPSIDDNSTKIATTEFCVNGFIPNSGNTIIDGTKTYTNKPIISNQYINSSSVLRVGNFTLTSPYFEVYPIAPTSNQTITIPPASAPLLGLRLRFRRVGGTASVTVNSASSNIYPNGSFGATNVLLATTAFNVVITCSYLTSTTYGWFV